jgi:hypothetical protein
LIYCMDYQSTVYCRDTMSGVVNTKVGINKMRIPSNPRHTPKRQTLSSRQNQRPSHPRYARTEVGKLKDDKLGLVEKKNQS